jgi:hypothetical protein
MKKLSIIIGLLACITLLEGIILLLKESPLEIVTIYGATGLALSAIFIALNKYPPKT